MTNIIDKLRAIINDFLQTNGKQSFEYLSTQASKIFTLFNSNVSSSTIIVYKNGEEWSSDNYSYDSSTAQITIDEESGEELEIGDVLLVTFSYYNKYSDTELINFIKAALAYLSSYGYGTFTCRSDEYISPTPTENEQYLIAMVAGILIKGDIRRYSTKEIDIVFNDNDSKEKRIKKLIMQAKKTYGSIIYIDPRANTYNEDELE